MAEFNLSNFLIGLTLFSLIVIGLAIPYADLGASYGTTVDASFNQTYTKIQIDASTVVP